MNITVDPNLNSGARLSDAGWSALANPRSIALVGASGRSSSVSFTSRFLQSNRDFGYSGEIFLINPLRDEILGQKCWPDLASLPKSPDIVAINLPDEKVIPAVEAAIASGAKALMVHSGGFGERGAAGLEREMRLKQLCAESGVAALGPNCLGIMSLANRVSISSFRYSPGLKAGPIAAISQSGSVASILISVAAPHGLSFIASTGNEAVTTTEDLISHAIDDPSTRMIVAFVEALRRPREMFALAARAREAGKPIIVLKAGLTEEGGEVSRGHTGALAGSGAVYRQAFRQAGVILVEDFDELAQTVELFATLKQYPARCRVGMLGTSGGELGTITDQCMEFGVELPKPAPDTLKKLQEALRLPPDVLPRNPVDAGTGFNFPGTYKDRMRAAIQPIAADPSIDMVVIAQGVHRDSADLAMSLNREIMAATAEEAAVSTKPMLVIASRSLPADGEVVSGLRDAGVPVLLGSREGLRALSHMSRYGSSFSASAAKGRVPAPRVALPKHSNGIVLQSDLFPWLAQNMLPVPRTSAARTAEQARAAILDLGKTAVMKIDTTRVVHKSDVGGVALGVTPEAASERFAALSSCLNPPIGAEAGESIFISEQITDGVEFYIGAKRDPGFGAVVVCGMGGRFLEIMGRTALLVTPFGPAEARDAIEQSGATPFLSGYRRGPLADFDLLANLIVQVGRLAEGLGEALDVMDLNPVIITSSHPQGIIADARLILREGIR